MSAKIDNIQNNMLETIDISLFKRAIFDEVAGEKSGYSNYSYWRSTLMRFKKNKIAMFFFVVLSFLLTFTILQPILPDQKSPKTIYSDENGKQLLNQKPSKTFWFGTNGIGQDLWARIWSGTRTSIFIGLAVGAWDTIIGILVGALWGYVRKLDRVITEIYNVIHNIPNTVILILVSYMLKPGVGTIIFAMCLTGWLPTAKFVRNQIIIIRDREFNLASRCLGTPISRVITKNLLPQLVSVIMMRVALAIPGAIGQEVFLTYLGLGLPVSIPSLGNLINEGRIVMMSQSLRYQLIFPTIVLSLITVSFYMMGNSFADAADPKNHV